MVWFVLFACSPTPTPAPVKTAEALSVEIGALRHPDAAGVAVVDAVTVNGKRQEIAFQPLLAVGEVLHGARVGGLVDAVGTPIPVPGQTEQSLCNVLDFGSILSAEGALFHVAHQECTLGQLLVTPLSQGADGRLQASGPPVAADQSAGGGGHVHCSGDVTPWGTHLSSEEYEPNARLADENGALPAAQMDMATKHPWEWSFHNLHAAYTPGPNPYAYGWVPELSIADATGTATVVKHYTLGRFSHELGLVLPDERTVYLTDDTYHGAFFLFVADQPRDLSAGTLYAARMQNDASGAVAIAWISLGHATDAQIAAGLNKRFEDLFDVAEGPECPEGFSRTTTTWGTECLRAKEPLLASRMESRRFAGISGATTELTKAEGLAWDSRNETLYLAMSKISQGLLEEKTTARGPAEHGDYRRAPEQDHLTLAENACGIVYALSEGPAVDASGARIDSDWVARMMMPAVVGKPTAEGCDPDAIANPDNLTFVDDYGWLIIAEDTDRHPRDTLWAWDVSKRALTPLMTVHPDSEVTGVHWFGDLNGFGYLTVSNQWGESDLPQHPSVAGYLGPFRR